jgi:hypothetical protein
VNVYPDVPQFREVSAPVTVNLPDDGTATGLLSFPPPTWTDLETLSVRLRMGQRGAGPDAFGIEWDAAWLEIYGKPSAVPPPPGEVRNLRVACDPSGVALSWDPLLDATGYDVFRGDLDALGPGYAHVLAGSSPATTTVDAQVSCGDAGNDYWLVAGTNAGGRGTCGTASDGTVRPCP